ncbi:MAG: type II secretion system F family protein [Capsulimonas sp.]|uniref:type II secretion system F family protein n=1 Tax=Capsulimonas sp. TaxID=2494211 RepID=UPI003266C14C
MLIAVVLLIFICTMALVIGLASPSQDRNQLSMRISNIARTMDDETAMKSLADAELDASFAERVVRPALRQLAGVAMKLSPSGASDATRMLLIRAGNPGKIGVTEFMGIKLIAFVVMLAAGFFASKIVADDILMRLVVIIFGGIAGLTLPDSVMQQMIGARQYKIRKFLPDTIDLLIVSVEAGLGFDAAMAKVVEKVKGPISEEFGKALDEMRVGKTRARALKDMSIRVEIPEVTSFVAAIYQSEQLGVSIASVLRVQSESIRIARTQRIREAAAKLPVKMLFPLIFCIFPAIFTVLIGPGLIAIMNAFKTM